MRSHAGILERLDRRGEARLASRIPSAVSAITSQIESNAAISRLEPASLCSLWIIVCSLDVSP